MQQDKEIFIWQKDNTLKRVSLEDKIPQGYIAAENLQMVFPYRQKDKDTLEPCLFVPQDRYIFREPYTVYIPEKRLKEFNGLIKES